MLCEQSHASLTPLHIMYVGTVLMMCFVIRWGWKAVSSVTITGFILSCNVCHVHVGKDINKNMHGQVSILN